jgi:thymidylate synthase (FAD)
MTLFYIHSGPPVVELIGVSQPIPDAIGRVMEYRGNDWLTDPIEGDPLALVEFGGRVCYESFDNKLQRSRLDYIKDTGLDKQHGSILEHAYFNFAVLDLPRNALMELSRHRVGVAYSWRSTRYVDNWVGYSLPPLLRMSGTQVQWMEEARRNFDHYEQLKADLKMLYPDLKKKQIIEAARSVLWGNCTTDGEFSCNLRSLLHIHKLRSDKGADPMMQEFAEVLLEAAKPHMGGLI